MMAHFFARVEIFNPDEGDYDQLHTAMVGAGYHRVIRLKDNQWYDLPTGEYYKNSLESINIERIDVEDAIFGAIKKKEYPAKDFILILTCSHTTNVCLKLKKSTNSAKLPPGEML